jgi:hypothetical protein
MAPCVFCGKELRAYKTWRDWKGRESHYKCYKADLNAWALKEQVRIFNEEEAAKKNSECSNEVDLGQTFFARWEKTHGHA